MIDLHTHTTASDGACTPEELVARASDAGLAVLAVTDHDTFGGCAAAAAACRERSIAFVTGIEVTAVVGECDVHVLGYFLDPESPSFNGFLEVQRGRRIERLRAMIDRLAGFGMRLDADSVLGPALTDPKKAAGRPWIARALVAAGHVRDVPTAFDRWLVPGAPTFVARIGASPAEVIERIHDAGGVASLAHPGQLGRDEWIRGFVDAGLDALEAYHRDHDMPTVARYLAMAERHGLAVSGGSDFHADSMHGGAGPGAVTLPVADYERLVEARAARRATASGSSTSS